MQAHRTVGEATHRLKKRLIWRGGLSRGVLHRQRQCKAALSRVWASQRFRLGRPQTGAMIRRQAQTLPWMLLQRKKLLILSVVC